MGLVPTRWYLMLVMPSSVGLALLAFGLVWMLRRARRGESWARLKPAATVAGAGTLLLYAACTPLVATLLSRSLERMTPYVRPEDAPVSYTHLTLPTKA